MFATQQYIRPFWQGLFLTATFCLLGFGTAKAVTEQPVDYSPAELEELGRPDRALPGRPDRDCSASLELSAADRRSRPVSRRARDESRSAAR